MLLDKVPFNTGKGLVDFKDNDNGQTSLSWAAKNGHNRVVELLLKTGMVDIDSKSENGQTPLSWAAEYGRDDVVKLLIGTGEVDINSMDRSGVTPLQHAAYSFRKTTEQLLLLYGATISHEFYGLDFLFSCVLVG